MEITVSLTNCSGCRHRDHSGAFTPGGAKAICGGPNVSDWVLKYKPETRNDNPNNPLTDINQQCYYWKHRIVEDHLEGRESFPEWCPLKNGECY